MTPFTTPELGKYGFSRVRVLQKSYSSTSMYSYLPSSARHPLSHTLTPSHHDTPRLDKSVVRFFPIRHLADIEVSRQFTFAGLFSTRKRTIVNNLALMKFFHTWYFENINTRHYKDISYILTIYRFFISYLL
jgi:hypothetical protein